MRLIDADALLEELKKTYKYFDLKFYIEDAPTIEPYKSAEQKSEIVPIGETISRADAIEAVQKDIEFEKEHAIPYEDYDSGCIGGLKKAIRTLNALPSADRPTLKQTDTMIIADALRYLIKDTERHELDRTRAEELREQILKYGASMCHSADRPQVNSDEWVAEKEKEFEELNRPNEDSKPQPYIPEASTERVVHCKDCIYSEEVRDGNDMFACNNINGMPGYVRGDDFCSSGSL